MGRWPPPEAGDDVRIDDVAVLAQRRRFDPALALAVSQPFFGRVADRRADDWEAGKNTSTGIGEDGVERGLGGLLVEVPLGRSATGNPGGPEAPLHLPSADPVLAVPLGPALPLDAEHVARGSSLILHGRSLSYAVPPGVPAPRGRLLGQVDVYQFRVPRVPSPVEDLGCDL